MHRFYRVEASPDLFGGILITREWGRIGTRGQHLLEWCACETDAQVRAGHLLQAKLRRDYVDVV